MSVTNVDKLGGLLPAWDFRLCVNGAEHVTRPMTAAEGARFQAMINDPQNRWMDGVTLLADLIQGEHKPDPARWPVEVLAAVLADLARYVAERCEQIKAMTARAIDRAGGMALGN